MLDWFTHPHICCLAALWHNFPAGTTIFVASDGASDRLHRCGVGAIAFRTLTSTTRVEALPIPEFDQSPFAAECWPLLLALLLATECGLHLVAFVDNQATVSLLQWRCSSSAILSSFLRLALT